MSRSCYSDDFGGAFPGQMDLYRANVERSIHSRRGQARLRELEAALVAMPVKALQDDVFVDGPQEQPQVCALGAWALAHCAGDVAKAHSLVPADVSDNGIADALKDLGWPKLVVFEAVFMNDEEWSRTTDERRYERMLHWVRSQLIADVTHG